MTENFFLIYMIEFLCQIEISLQISHKKQFKITVFNNFCLVFQVFLGFLGLSNSRFFQFSRFSGHSESMNFSVLIFKAY